MPVPISIRTRKARDQNIRTKGSNHPHHIPQRDIVTFPFLKRLFRILGITKIRHPREALLDTVVAVRRQQLQRAQDP